MTLQEKEALKKSVKILEAEGVRLRFDVKSPNIPEEDERGSPENWPS